jgi:hypothetical protein
MRLLSGKKFCIYTHSIEGVVFYVGKGSPSRPFSAVGRNARWKELTRNTDYDVEIISWFASEQDAYAAERLLIEMYRPSCNIVYNWAFDTIQEDAPMTEDTMTPAVEGHSDTLQFDAGKFLETSFKGPADLVQMVSAYQLGDIPYATAAKWYQRRRISALWLPNLLCALEFEHGKAVAVREFFA